MPVHKMSQQQPVHENQSPKSLLRYRKKQLCGAKKRMYLPQVPGSQRLSVKGCLLLYVTMIDFKGYL